LVKISIIGLGFVGLSLTSTLSSKGYKVVGIDIDEKKCEKVSLLVYVLKMLIQEKFYMTSQIYLD